MTDQINTWTDNYHKYGRTYAPFHFWIGWAGLLIASWGVYAIIVSIARYGVFLSPGAFMAYFSVIVFAIGGGSHILITRHMVNVARVLELTECNHVRVEFWWRSRRSDIVFDIRAVERVESFFEPYKRLRFIGLEQNKWHYKFIINGHPPFYISGEIEGIDQFIAMFPDEVLTRKAWC